MNKEKYLKELEKRLLFLNPEDKQAEIFRVSNDFDSDKVVNDLSIEVNDIYKKYNIDYEKKLKNANKKYVVFLNSIGASFEKFINHIKKNNTKENINVFMSILVLVLITSILKLPFIGIETLVFSIFKTALPTIFYNVFNIIIELLYIIFAIYFFINVFKKLFKDILK